MFWSVARTLNQREAFAAERLKESGFDTLLPRIHKGKTITPLFSGYLFVAIVEQWRAIDRTLGVLKLVRFGDAPSRVPDREIEALRARMGSDGIIKLPPPPEARKRLYTKGVRVRITGGAFDGLGGIHSGMTSGEREVVLLVMLGAAREVKVARHLVQPA
jgi:transcriptional antiterminator RfaH